MMSFSGKHEKTVGVALDLSAIFLSAALLTLVFPGFSYAHLAWVALIPLILQIYRSGYCKAAGSAFVCAFIFYACFLSWTIRIDTMNPPRFIMFGIYLSSFFALFAVSARFIHRTWPRWDALTIPSIWIVLEYLRCNIGFLSFPLGLLGYSQYQVLPVAGIASYAGVYGVSFVIVAVNVAFASIAWSFLSSARARSRMNWRLSLSPVLVIASTILLISVLKISSGGEETTETVRDVNIGVVQLNEVTPGKPAPDNYYSEILPLYEKMTLETAKSGASLVIWPSFSVPGVLSLDRKMTEAIGDISKKGSIHLVVGSAALDKFNAEQTKTQRLFTSAYLFSPKGALTGRYDKIRLFPFDEYLPGSGHVNWPSWLVGKKKEHYPGKKLTLFQAGQFRFGAQICFENMFPDQFRQLAASGSDFVIALNNDWWAKSTAAQYQLLSYCVFRAIENQRPVIRSSTNGISSIIGPDGRILSTVKDASGKEVNIAGVSNARVAIPSAASFYNRFGDVFCLAVMTFIMALLAWATTKRLSYSNQNYRYWGGSMSIVKKITVWLVTIALCALSFKTVHAADADVLPKGKFAFNAEYKHYLSWDSRYDKDGHEQDAASDFNGTLGSNIFPSLKVFDGLVPGTPNVGVSNVSFEYSYDRIDTTLAYGITDQLSFGVKVPYIWYKNKVNANVDSTNANIGKNPAFNPNKPPSATNPPLIPTAMGGVKLTTKDVQDLLGDGLYINGGLAVPGYNFKPIKTWEDEGVGDIETGLKYQYYKSENWKLAGAFGAFLPTGRVDDEDNLVDQPFGGGCYSFFFRSLNDYTGIKNVVLNGSAFYTWTLSQDRDKRIVSDPHTPLTRLEKNVEIDTGDRVELETSAKYLFDKDSPLVGTSLELLYHYSHSFKDQVSGGDGLDLSGLEKETDVDEHYYIAKVGYSTVPLFMAKKFPVPADISLGYRNRFAGNNNAFKTQFIQISGTIYF